MIGVNQLTIVGNLGRDADLRTTQNGTSVASMNVAVNRRVKKGGQYQDHTDWFRVALFGKRAEALAPSLTKGTMIQATGSVECKVWTPDNGEPRAQMEVIAITFELLGGGNREQRHDRDVTYLRPAQNKQDGPGEFADDKQFDDIPF